MKRFSPVTQAALAAVLCFVAGYVDALAYLRSDVFVANMTGNTVLVGIAVAQQQWMTASFRTLTVCSFFIGGIAGRILLTASAGRQWVPLGIEASLLAAAGYVALPDAPWTLLFAFAMGLQATAATHFGGLPINTVVVTSAIARVAEGVADHIRPAGGAHLRLPPLQGRIQFLAWASYLVGAGLAATLRSASWSAYVPAAALVLLAGRLARSR